MRKIVKPCGLHCIRINHLGVTIGEQQILSDVNLHIHCGTLTVLIGRNGAGKSTLIRAILNDIPHTGSIEFKDRENGHIQKLRIGYVPQNLNIEKSTPVSVYDMIASYQSNRPVFLYKSKKLYQEIKESLKMFEAEHLIDKQVCNLSGGELQRVLLSMAVAGGGFKYFRQQLEKRRVIETLWLIVIFIISLAYIVGSTGRAALYAGF